MSKAARGYAQFIDISCPQAQAFAAFTSKELLERWYAQEATVDARKGGVLKVRTRDGKTRDAIIDIYEQDRRLRLIYMPDRSLPTTAGAGPIVEDILFDLKPGRTVVRVLGNGVPDQSEWNAYFVWLRQGWAYWLHGLKKMIEAGTPPGPAA